MLQAARARRGNDSFTTVLLHFDGADASTTFTDSNAGGSAHTWTAVGNAQLDNGIAPKFGSAAGLFDGTGDRITTPDSSDFTMGSGDFTVDLWFNLAVAGVGTRRFLFAQMSSGATDFSMFAELNASNQLSSTVSTDGTTQVNTISPGTYTTAGWHHYAMVRVGSVIRIFVDGTQVGSDLAFASALRDSAQTFAVGGPGLFANLEWNGSIDEFRISKGIARWTTTFVPPKFPYSRGGKASAPSFAMAA